MPFLLLASQARAEADRQDFTLIERGRYLTTLGDCAACHTNKGSRQAFAGGRAIATPFGTLLAPNITPDRQTGIGAWSDDEFVSSLKAGTGRNGKHIYPAMPYTYLTHVTRQDALAIRAYLATVPAVHNEVVSNQLPFPLDLRAGLIAWNALFFTPGDYKPDPGRSAEWNRGAYLVTGLEHCGMCHTGKNVVGGDRTAHALQGNVLQGWYAPNITNDARRGLGSWSVEDVATYLRAGHNRVAAASGPMAEEVMISSTELSDSDLRAMAVYLKSLPGQGDAATPLDANDARMQAGAAIYRDACSACHTPDGAGIAGLFPTLRGAPGVQSTSATSLIRVILAGAQSASTAPAPTAPAMPSFAWQLSDRQVADVATYIRSAWGNAAPAVGEGQVRSARRSLPREREN